MAQALNVDQLIIRGDSKAVVRQVTGSFETKESHIKKYAALAKSLLKDFKVTWFEKIDRKNNQRADEVSKAIAREKFQGMWLEPLLKKSIDNEILPIEIENNRITPLEQYIAHDILPKDPVTAHKTRTIATRYVIVRDDLYRTIEDWPLLKCVLERDGEYVLWEMHEGI